MGVFEELLAKKEELEAQLEKLNNEFTEVAKTKFGEWAKDLFGRYPGLEQITWTAYTPYFNDGDPCYFRSCHTYASINSDECEEFDRENFTEEEADKLEKEIYEFMSKFSDEDMERLFGDHVKVTLTKNGVDVDEYDHD